MSLQWAIVACFLYLELAFVILLLLPIISVERWNKMFKSKFLISINQQAHLYFYGFLIILILLFVDSIREMRRYSHGKEQDNEHGHLDAELQHSMKLFRAQRNFYIAGFALFLYLVIRRLVLLINAYARVIADQKASLSQAQSATQALKNYLNDDSGSASKDGNKKGTGDKVDSLDKLKGELKTAKEESKKKESEFYAMKSQCDNLTKEYDRLSEENAKLQKKYDQLVSSSGAKKSD